MNPIWALLFKDRIRTPFSVYKMSLAEVVFLVSLIFGAGYGIGKLAKLVIDSAGSEQVIVTE
tara:strand:+ start:205 stop:390 length:186 start_codon:yes stop_codon:yes gene_type:complete